MSFWDYRSVAYKLKPKYLLVSTVIVALLLVTSLLIFLPPNQSDNGSEELIEWSPEWYVRVGDTFRFLLTIKDTTSSNLPYEDLKYSEYNGTEILVEIISLPELPKLVNSSILINSILKVTKTEIRLANGSTVQQHLVSFLNNAFSLSFVPIDGWEEIESLLPREVAEPSEPFYDVAGYFARIDDSYTIGYFNWYIDVGGGYGGNITYTTGIPFMVYRYWDSISDSDPEVLMRADII